MIKVAYDFLELLKSDQYKVVDATIKTRPELSSAVLPMCLTEMQRSLLAYDEIEPGKYTTNNGDILNRFRNSDFLMKPYGMSMDDDMVLLTDYDKHNILVMTMDWELKQKYELYTQNTEFRNPRHAIGDKTHIYVALLYNKIVAINKETGIVDWDFGVYNSRGTCADGKMGKPVQLAFTPDGNILVVTYDGAGDKLKYYGTVEEFTPDGDWVKTHLQFDTTGLGVDYETRYPKAIKVYDDMVYIGYSNFIDVFQYDKGDFVYYTTITKPTSEKVQDLSLTDFYLEGTKLYIVASALKQVVCFDIITKKILFYVGHYSYENYPDAVHEGNGMNNPVGILVNRNGVFVTDAGNYNLFEIFDTDYQEVYYKLPEDIEIVYSSMEIDEDGYCKTEIGKVPPNLHLVYTKTI